MAQTMTPDVQPQDQTRRSAEERRATAWVGKSVVFKGELSSSEDMTIDGRVEGSIDVHHHALVIGPDADIRADITAGSVTVFGAVHGNIMARDKVEVRQTASVSGDILTPRLALVEGGTLRGRVDTEMRTQAKP
jgi:cytoskeletal protein CcmA (bactofilin family)